MSPKPNPIKFIPPVQNGPNQSNQGVVYKDSPLSIYHAFAFQKKENEKDPNTLVFTAESPQEISGILQVLHHVKIAGPGQTLDPQRLPIPKSMMLQSYVDQNGRINPAFAEKISTQTKHLHIEIILENAVLVMNENGIAYVHSKGEAINTQQIPPFWLSFYNKSAADDQQKQTLMQNSSHFHTIKQQDDDYSGVDWILANLNTLKHDIGASDDTLKNAQKINRSQLINRINGQQDLRDPANNNGFQLDDKSNERKNEKQERMRKDQLQTATELHGFFHQEAVDLKEEATPQNNKHAFRQRTSDWVEVFITEPPQYIQNDEDANKIKTTRTDSSGIENNFDIKEGSIVAKSTQGENITYKERFTRIAEDLYVLLNGKITYPIEINAIRCSSRPPTEEQQQDCVEAFEKVFGKGNIIISPVSTEEEEENKTAGLGA